MGDMVERVALAIKAETDKFSDPVEYYVRPEAQHRWERAHPGMDWLDESGQDALESYRIIARAAIEAMRAPTPEMVAKGSWAQTGRGEVGGTGAENAYTTMVDFALKEQPPK